MIQCCAYFLPDHTLLLTSFYLYNNYVFLCIFAALSSCQASFLSINSILLQNGKNRMVKTEW